MHTSRIFLVGLLGGALAGALTSFLILSTYSPSPKALIRDYYATENAVHVSPHGIRKGIMEGKNDVILVDLRSTEEYEREHIVGAISIPAYKDKDRSDYGATDRIITAFRSLPQEKDIVVYCYSMPCMTGRKVGQMLAENGISVRHLGIGWNEWRHFWTLWNHEHEWELTNVEEYVASGSEPGSFKGTPSITPCDEGSFGC